MNEKAVLYFLKTGDAKKTAQKFNCSESSVRRWTKIHTQNGYKQVRYKVLKKYDLNNDGYISLEEYMEVNKQDNKDAKQLHGYNYQHLSNIFTYLFLFLSDTLFGKYAAIADSYVVVRQSVIRASASIDCHKKTLYFPKRMVTSVRKALKQQRNRFIYFTLTIFPDSRALGHVNACIIDKKKRTLERFETYGEVTKSRRICVDNIFDRFVMQRLNLHNYTYLRPLDLSPLKGIQKIADSKDGMCVTIVMMYFQMRIMNPDKSQKKLVKDLLAMGANELKQLILQYADYIKDFMTVNNFETKQLDKQLMTLQMSIPISTRPTKKIKEFEKLFKKKRN